MFKIQIPEPCREDWNKMLPTTKGAYCKACCKEVIDFTSISDQDVEHYFLNKTGDNTCGRFRYKQLHRIRIHLPENLFIQKIAAWKKYMAVLLLAFGSLLFGCDVGVENKKESKAVLSSTIKTTIEKTDKSFHPNDYVGGMVLTYDLFSIKKDFSKEMQYVTYGYTVMAFDDTADIKSVEDTLQIKMDTCSLAPLDTTFVSTTIPSDTLAKKIVTDTSECNGAGFY